MSEAGYTLAETLTALAMVGLAMGGVAAGMQMIGRLQLSTSNVVAANQGVRATQARLEDLFRSGEPYRSHEGERFVGGPQLAQFDCGAAARCEARLERDGEAVKLRVTDANARAHETSLATDGDARFVYQGSLSTSEVWPPLEPGRQALRAVLVIARPEAGETALLETRLWAEQPRRCDYDPILRDCR